MDRGVCVPCYKALCFFAGRKYAKWGTKFAKEMNK